MANRRTVTARSGRDAEGELGFRHILVPTDLTERTDKALQLARRLSSRDRTRITMVHIIETIEGLPFEDLRTFQADGTKSAHGDEAPDETSARRSRQRDARGRVRATGRRDRPVCGSQRRRSHRPCVASRQSVPGEPRLGHHQLSGWNTRAVSGPVGQIDTTRIRPACAIRRANSSPVARDISAPDHARRSTSR